MLEKGWIGVDHLQATTTAVIELKRPPRVYYPVNDILAAPEWSTLLPDERRIALDLMVMMWAGCAFLLGAMLLLNRNSDSCE